jgi:Rhodanese-related sulfurtransferase
MKSFSAQILPIFTLGLLAYLCQSDISYNNPNDTIKVEAVVTKNYDNILLADLLILQRQGLCTIIDVRESQYFQQAHLPAALNWNSMENPIEFSDEIRSAIAKNNSIILYGNKFSSSVLKQSASILEKHQIKPQIYWGGWEEWKACGLDEFFSRQE